LRYILNWVYLQFHEIVLTSLYRHFLIASRLNSTLVAPTILYPVTPDMRCYNEEQFGPLVPVARFSHLQEIYTYLQESKFGQQASVFGSDATEIASLIDVLVNQVCRCLGIHTRSLVYLPLTCISVFVSVSFMQVARVNINTQCQRGPDSFPFTGASHS
jgi:glyceraldehyde-3-phosphate dehydrogenase (NADP+)